MKKILKDIALLLILVAVVISLILLPGLLREPDGDRVSHLPTEEYTTPSTEPETLPAETEAPPAEPETLPAETEPQPEEFLLTFVGDCTLGATDEHSYMGYGFHLTVGEDYGWPFRNVLAYFEADDLTFVNLEGPLTDQRSPDGKRYVFRGPTSYVNILTQGSVEVVSLANNHAEDHLKQGYESTRKVLDEAGITYAQRDSATIFTTDRGLTVGIYGAMYYLLDEETIVSAISELREQVDLVIFAPHWGVEHTFRPDDDQIRIGHAAIDAGADIVWGSHPHVLQPVEEYNGGIIYYSMGNFSFGGNIYPGDYDTAILQQKVIREPDGTVHLGELIRIPASISSIPKRNNYQPTPYTEGTEEYTRTLSKLDGTYDGPNLPVS